MSGFSLRRVYNAAGAGAAAGMAVIDIAAHQPEQAAFWALLSVGIILAECRIGPS
jgi:hypothetical protein